MSDASASDPSVLGEDDLPERAIGYLAHAYTASGLLLVLAAIAACGFCGFHALAPNPPASGRPRLPWPLLDPPPIPPLSREREPCPF